MYAYDIEESFSTERLAASSGPLFRFLTFNNTLHLPIWTLTPFRLNSLKSEEENISYKSFSMSCDNFELRECLR